jgi:cutinase
MRGRQALCLVVATLSASAGWSVAVPTASAEPCPDVEVVFARGTGQWPGLGDIGQAFVDAVRSQAGGRTVGSYAVDYPASGDFADAVGFPRTVTDGIRDEAFRVQFMSEACPQTRLILGGYSQGAAVTGLTASATTPASVPAELVPPPVSPEAATHVAAVVLFGKPAADFVPKYEVPVIAPGPLFADRTLELCAPADSVCDGVEGKVTDPPNDAHTSYVVNGMVGEGAAFAASKL